MSEEKRGLARAQEIYEDRPRRARELQAEGKKIMGYICLYPPVEMMTALDMVPYRVFGDMKEPFTKADTVFPSIVCPFIRSCIDLGLKGHYDFLDGLVGSHVCDVGEKLPRIFEARLDYPYFHFIDVPHTSEESAVHFFKCELENFQGTLENYAGKKITPEALKKAVADHNRQRSLVRKLYDLNAGGALRISGVEILQVMVALMSIPVDEGSALLEKVISEVSERSDGPPKQPVRLLVWGSIIDSTSIMEMIESVGANVVIDDTCVGTRAFWADVEETEDPLDGLAYRYMVGLKCPRTFRAPPLEGQKKDYMADLENRFDYLKESAKRWNVDGAILQSVTYCDIHGYEVPLVMDYLESIGVPSTYLEHDYSEGSLAPMRTRVQAFLETID